MMKLCAKGASRQQAHEEIRLLSSEASSVVKNEVSRPCLGGFLSTHLSDLASTMGLSLLNNHRINRTT